MKARNLNFILYGFLFFAFSIGCTPAEFTVAKVKSLERNNFILNPGDCFAFKAGSENYFVAIYIDYTHEMKEYWCEFWFTDYYYSAIPEFPEISRSKIVGHKVGSQFESKGYYTGLHFEGLPLDSIVSSRENIQLIGNVKIDKTKIRMGSQGASGSYSSFIEAFLSHRETANSGKRPKISIFPWPEKEFFPLNDFIVDPLIR